jgi:hypothetical protein
MSAILKKATITTLLFCTCAVLMAASTARRLIIVKGRIVAFRPFDRAVQAPSFIPNREVFLLQLDSPNHDRKSKIIKIDYRHFDPSDITPEILKRSPLLKVRVTRNRSCDEDYGHLVSNAPVIEMLDNISEVEKLDDPSTRRKAIEPIRFTAGFDDTSLSPDLKLKCYALEKGNFQVVYEKPAQNLK